WRRRRPPCFVAPNSRRRLTAHVVENVIARIQTDVTRPPGPRPERSAPMTAWKVRPLAAAVIVLSAVILSGPAAPPLVAQSKPPITLRLPWNTSIDNHIGRGAQHLAKRANELTGGQVTIRLFPNAGLGSEQQALEGMQAGTGGMGYITVYTNAVKLGVVLDLPFLFRDFAHWKKAVDGTPGRTIAEAAPAAGVRVLAWHIGGWRDVYGSKPLRTVDDFKGFKLRTQQAVAI